MWRRLTMCTMAVLAAVVVSGCTSEVSGRVVSMTTGNPIPGATVRVGQETTSTDASGTFVISRIKNGQQTVAILASGYPESTTKIVAAREARPIEVELSDSALSGSVTELAVERKRISTGTVSVRGVELPISEDGSFSASGLMTGDATLTIVSPNHVTRELAIALRPGDNAIEASMSITAAETYRRFNAAEKFGRWDQAYKYLHPDVRKLKPYKKFKADGAKDGTMVSLKLGDERSVPKFTSKYTNRTYRDGIVQIDRTIVMQYPGYGNVTDNMSQYWQLRDDGMWYFIWNFKR